MDPKELFEEILVRETQLTSHDLHAKLQRAFIAHFSTPTPTETQ